MLTPDLPVTGRARSRRQRRALTAAGLCALIVLTACGGKSKTAKSTPSATPSATTAASSASSSASEAASSSATEAASSSATESSSSAAGGTGEKVTINWFVGLGTGADQGQPAKEKAVVDAFNAANPDINLKMTIVANAQAATTLATQIAAGNGPDIVGPVGIRGSNQFEGQWLDLAPLVESQKFDTSIFEKAQMDAQKDSSGAQTALPFGVYPSFLWYNKALFDDAGLPYPPQKWGDQYDGKEWNTDALKELAKKLTVDADGNDATSPKFNPDKVVQWGYHEQFGEGSLQRHGSLFGAGSFVADDKKTAQIPPQWLAEWKWRQEMVWKDHSSPNAKQLAGDTLNKGNAFETGKIAMAHTHLWYLCCMKDSKDKPQTFWDIAALPSYNGKITATLHSDSFRLMKATKHPEQAFKVLAYFLTTGAPDLLKIYNAMPANSKLQDDYFASLDKVWTQHPNWQVAKDALQYPDVPNHEGWTPAFTKAETRAQVLGTKLITDPKTDLDAEAKSLQADLQKIFDAGK